VGEPDKGTVAIAPCCWRRLSQRSVVQYGSWFGAYPPLPHLSLIMCCALSRKSSGFRGNPESAITQHALPMLSPLLDRITAVPWRVPAVPCKSPT